jgi:quercetin dioxygenase-like cupin family protein
MRNSFLAGSGHLACGKLVCLALGIVCLAGFACAQSLYGEYPVPGRKSGSTAFGLESNAERQASRQYPAWFRGNARDGKADEFSKYFFTQLVGPQEPGTSGFDANNLRMGTLVLKPGATYPAHNHPAREIYYVAEGEADWFVDDEKQHVSAGSVILHRPYAVHGWTNSSKTKPLKVIWIQWREEADKADALDQGARLVNPQIAKDEATAKPFAIPLPAVR